ncbi:MAG: J domain-containing protein, partial [Anaerolineae bacterium]|nr:J domain-containing protein [Anaerolineae bacterium]
TVRYGYVVDYGRIGGGEIHSANPHLRGSWRVGGFDAVEGSTEDPFSSTRDPLAAAYTVLGLTPEADIARVKQAYRTLARLYHPDLSDEDDALHRMQQINAAYQQIVAREE